MTRGITVSACAQNINPVMTRRLFRRCEAGSSSVSGSPEWLESTFSEIEIVSVQTNKHGYISTMYVINITSSCVIPTFVRLDIYSLNNRDLIVFNLKGKYPIISVTDLRDIWN